MTTLLGGHCICEADLVLNLLAAELVAGGEAGNLPVTKSSAQDLASTARQLGIRLIPEFNCLGHQGLGDHLYPLLCRNRDFEEPVSPPHSGCHSWCPRHPGVMPIVRSLMDEIIDAFDADAIHVGMDEVMQISSPFCIRGCGGCKTSDLFAQAVNELHTFVVCQKGLEMLMWATAS